MQIVMAVPSEVKFRARADSLRFSRRVLLALLWLLFFPVISFASSDWTDEVVYFVLIDRYADGDSTNNRGVERNNPGGFHGGDLKGLAAQLDSLADRHHRAVDQRAITLKIPVAEEHPNLNIQVDVVGVAPRSDDQGEIISMHHRDRPTPPACST